MCEFISWIEKDDKVYFLTHNQIYHTRRGKALQQYNGNQDDLMGHGAIRWFYDFEGGSERECFDFSTPDNFPSKIVKAVKSGKMKGFGGVPRGLLMPNLDNDYWAKRKPLYDDYYAKRKPLDNDYWDLFAIPKNRNPIWR